jgi:hypothetical protein
VIHDASDLPTDVLKIVNQLKLEGHAGLFLTEFCFVLNLITWAVTRLYLFPRFIWHGIIKSTQCWGSAIFGWSLSDGRGYNDAMNQRVIREFMMHQALIGEDPTNSLKHIFFIIVVLSILLCMHVYWFGLFLRIAKRLVLRGEESHDIAREEYEGDSDVEEEEEEVEVNMKKDD